MMGPSLPPVSTSTIADVLEILKIVSDPAKAKKTMEQITASLESYRIALQSFEQGKAEAEKMASEFSAREAALISAEAEMSQRKDKIKEEALANSQSAADVKARQNLLAIRETEFSQTMDKEDNRIALADERVRDREAKANALMIEARALRDEFTVKLEKLRSTVF
jgi:hypothetical protein